MIASGPLANRSFMAAMLILAVPVFMQQLMAAGVGLVDKVLAGSLSSDVSLPALDAIGIGSYIGWLIGICMAGLGIGGQALIARAMGSGDRAMGQRALAQTMLLSFVWGGMVGVVLWFVAPSLAAMAGLSDVATAMCVEYIRILAIAMPCWGVMMVGAMCLFGAGQTIVPAVIALMVNVVNIGASWAISGVEVRWGEGRIENPFTWDIGFAGIAIGTSLAVTVGAVLTIAALRIGVKDLRLTLPDLWPDRSMMGRVAKVGIPTFFDGIAMWSANLIVLFFIGMISAKEAVEVAIDTGMDAATEGLIGAHIIAVQWESFSFMPGFALGIAAGSISGQYLGAGNHRLAKRAILSCAGVGVVMMGALGIGMIVFGRELTAIISPSELHQDLVPQLLVIGGSIQVFFGLGMICRQGLRGAGDTLTVMLLTMGSSFLIRLPAAWFFGIYMEWGLVGVWIGLCGEMIPRSFLFLGRVLHGGWMKREI
jgi:putative MATE family efflux protein